MSILIVDDTDINLMVLKSILEQAGYTELHTARSASDAFEVLGLDNPTNVSSDVDLILMDIMMLEIDGIATCRRVKENEHRQDIPIIMVTELTEIENLEAAFAAGAMDYITKPFEKLEVLTRVRSALALKHEIDRRKTREKKLLKDLFLAKKVQQSVLSVPIHNDQIEIDAAYVPSEELSGDMYYWCDIDHNRYGILLLDVVGHGVPASLVSMSVRSLLRGMITRLADPVRVVQELNHHMRSLFGKDQLFSSHYFTAIYLVVDTQKQEIEYVNAGHPPALVILEDGTIGSLDRNSIPIGLRKDIPIEKGKLSYTSPSRIILYTDGLVQVPGESILISIEHLKTRLRKYHQLDNRSFIQRVFTDQKQRNELSDDICLISITTKKSQTIV